MTRDERERLVEFLRKKQCRPRRNGDLNSKSQGAETQLHSKWSCRPRPCCKGHGSVGTNYFQSTIVRLHGSMSARGQTQPLLASATVATYDRPDGGAGRSQVMPQDQVRLHTVIDRGAY